MDCTKFYDKIQEVINSPVKEFTKEEAQKILREHNIIEENGEITEPFKVIIVKKKVKRVKGGRGMKVIKPGVKPKPVTQIFTCDKCGCIFEASSEDGLTMIETVDRILYSTERRYVPVGCPTCGMTHRLYLGKAVKLL